MHISIISYHLYNPNIRRKIEAKTIIQKTANLVFLKMYTLNHNRYRSSVCL